MWTPTHVKVTVLRAEGLLYKGKNGTNDVFVTIELGKEKYVTSVKEKATDPVEWLEQCELPIPKEGTKEAAEVVLTVLHRNDRSFLGDEFLGMIALPLSEFDVYERPKNAWYSLNSKSSKAVKEKNTKNRGDLEVRIEFTVVAVANNNAGTAGSLVDLSKKPHKSSFGQLASSVGGSLLSLGKKKKGLKGLVKSVGLSGRGKKKKDKNDSIIGTIPEEQRMYSSSADNKQQSKKDADPGVISDDDDEDEFRFDELSHKSSHSSLAVSQRDGSLENVSGGGGEFFRRTYATATPPPKIKPVAVIEEEEKEKYSTRTTTPADSIDDWGAKLFGKQNNSRISTEIPSSRSSPFIPNKTSPALLSGKILPSASYNNNRFNESVKSDEVILDVVKTELNEPIPKPRGPRQMLELIKSESKVKSLSLESISTGSQSEEKPKKDPSKSDPPPTPRIGITNPIRVDVEGNGATASAGQETRLPRETLRKFEGKSREDLIEMIMTLQSAVDDQKQQMSAMENYIDNLLVRVMETKPTLLQNPSKLKWKS